MKNNDSTDFAEDLELKAAVKDAFAVPEVPENLRKAIHIAAEREWFEQRKRSRNRMRFWASGLTTAVAALAVCMYSTAQYFGARAEAQRLSNLNYLMDLVTISYIDDDVTDEELENARLVDNDVTLDALAARFDRMHYFPEEE